MYIHIYQLQYIVVKCLFPLLILGVMFQLYVCILCLYTDSNLSQSSLQLCLQILDQYSCF